MNEALIGSKQAIRQAQICGNRQTGRQAGMKAAREAQVNAGRLAEANRHLGKKVGRWGDRQA